MELSAEQFGQFSIAQTGRHNDVADENLDRVVRLAAHALDARYAAFSVCDDARQKFISSVGVDIDALDCDQSVCHVVAALGEQIIIDDAREDRYWSVYPGVRDNPEMVSYIGAPIRGFGREPIGTLGIWHNQRRNFHQPVTQRVVREAVHEIENSVLVRGMTEATTTAQSLTSDWG